MGEVKSWVSDIEEGTRLQAERLSRCPVVSGHVALMPDAHVGMGATIGSVIPTEGAIIPSAVGVDIGCGMIGTETDPTANDLPDSLQPLVPAFGASVPAGVGRGHGLSTQAAAKWMESNPHELEDKLQSRALEQLGSLGSGNHFLEVCLDERDKVWVVIHSGSRGVGNILATQHIRVAKDTIRLMKIALEDPDLAYFLEGSDEFNRYVGDMLWSQDYALANREFMMDAALKDVFALIGKGQEVSRINCHHNFAVREEHDGRSTWITRKGAIRAQKGDLGIIPGSMGTKSYIVEGLGNPASYNSCAHGAGRRMSRKQAKRELSVESLVERMAGKAWNRDNPQALLDEHPDAYKDIDQVMEDQKDLVAISHTLHQIVNYKGV